MKAIEAVMYFVGAVLFFFAMEFASVGWHVPAIFAATYFVCAIMLAVLGGGAIASVSYMKPCARVRLTN